jgi:outer membrane protein
VRQAQAVLDQRRYQVQEAGRAVTQQVAAAWIELETARVSIIARREQSDAARIAAEGVAEEARLGARSTIDVLDADQERLEADAEVVRALRNEYVAIYGVLQAMGLLTVRHLGLGIPTYNPDVNFAKVQSGPIGGYDTSAVDRIRSRWERR